jgi:hypothetical protein
MTKKLLLAALLMTSLAGAARAEDAAPAPAPEQGTPAQAGTRQRLRDGSGAGGQHRYGAQGGAARGACDGSMSRDRLRDGSGAGAQRGRMAGGCRK